MHAPLRTRSRWIAGIVVLAAGLGGLHPAPSPAAAGGSGATSALVRARREQALIRAEVTAELLRVLEQAPTLPGGGP